MKRILITGADSYIGTSFEQYLRQWPDAYSVDTLDMWGEAWKSYNFSGYDTVFHVAGITHIKETKKNANLYFDINRDLAFDIAKKAKAAGVKQIIFVSTMAVYGVQTGVIKKDTLPKPTSSYAKSKLEAEEQIVSIGGQNFKVAILRPPMVYGNGCKGNFQEVVKIVKKINFFPKVKNQRSMIYIDNLCSFVKLLIDTNAQGLFFPQNREYVCTSKMAALIAENMGKKLYQSVLLGYAVKLLGVFIPRANKAFGDLTYLNMDEHIFSYQTTEFEKSVRQSI